MTTNTTLHSLNMLFKNIKSRFFFIFFITFFTHIKLHFQQISSYCLHWTVHNECFYVIFIIISIFVRSFIATLHHYNTKYLEMLPPCKNNNNRIFTLIFRLLSFSLKNFVWFKRSTKNKWEVRCPCTFQKINETKRSLRD